MAVYVVVRDYRGEASDVVAQAQQRQESLKEAMRGIKGLVGYYIVDTGNGGLASVSIFEDRAGAEESIRVAATWVRENMAQWAPNPPTIIQGEVAIDLSR
jgi:hypothetical protein